MLKRRILLFPVCVLLSVCLCACVDDHKGVPNPAQSQPQSETAQSSTADSSSSSTANTEVAQSTEIALDDPLTLGAILRGSPDDSFPSGLAPLPQVQYAVPDPDNRRGLSTAKKEHSHGPASGGKAHDTVEAFQDMFDRFGALTLDRTDTDNVLYLTFDCGWEYENLTARVLDTLREKQVPAAFFCTLDHIKKQPALIARMIREGHIVGNHSDTHPSFPSISRTQMVKEIADTENYCEVHKETYDARGLHYNKDAERWLQLIAATEAAMQARYLRELDGKGDAAAFRSACFSLFSLKNLSFDPVNQIDGKKDIPDWIARFNEYAGQSGITVYAVDIDSNSYVIGAAPIADYAQAAETAGEVGIRITSRPD